MTRQSWIAVLLSRHTPPRSVLSWLLLLALVAGAAAYTQGSRYALVPGVSSTHSTAVDQANAGTGPSFTQFHGSAAPQPECCERRHAPRSEPAPLRTSALDPPVLAPRPSSADGIQPAASPPEPELPALTVIQLSISRT